jgi:hypothetical protein
MQVLHQYTTFEDRMDTADDAVQVEMVEMVDADAAFFILAVY